MSAVILRFPPKDRANDPLANLSELLDPGKFIPVPVLDPARQCREFAGQVSMICRQSAQLHRQTCQVLERALLLADVVHQESPSVCAVTSNRDGGPHVCLHETERSHDPDTGEIIELDRPGTSTAPVAEPESPDAESADAPNVNAGPAAAVEAATSPVNQDSAAPLYRPELDVPEFMRRAAAE